MGRKWHLVLDGELTHRRYLSRAVQGARQFAFVLPEVAQGPPRLSRPDSPHCQLAKQGAVLIEGCFCFLLGSLSTLHSSVAWSTPFRAFHGWRASSSISFSHSWRTFLLLISSRSATVYRRLVQIGGAAQARRAAVAPLTERSAELPPVRAGERGCALSPPLQVLMLQTEVRRVDAKKERVEL